MDSAPTIDAMRTAAHALKLGDTREKLRAVQAAQDALDAAKAVLLAELRTTREYEDDGASSLNMWARTQLRLGAGQATALVKNMTALRDLPLVGEAAVSGQISAAHVRVFVYGLAHVGLDLMRHYEEALVAVAVDAEPGAVVEVIQDLHARNYPQDLDEKYQDGMDKQDFAVDALPEGWHVSGFLNTITGAKLKKVLDSVSAPDGADDTRTGCQPTRASNPTSTCSSTPTPWPRQPTTSSRSPSSRT